jgi:hypothetical protein
MEISFMDTGMLSAKGRTRCGEAVRPPDIHVRRFQFTRVKLRWPHRLQVCVPGKPTLHLLAISNTTDINEHYLIYVLNFGLDEIGELFLKSAPRIDLHQAEARFFQAASSALLRIQTTRLITWKKERFIR